MIVWSDGDDDDDHPPIERPPPDERPWEEDCIGC